jgi:uncharacterized membrane protein YoaK (UPF0700 family)
MLTIVTGLVDAVSYLALGHVFVANMTGNVVFLGFALAGAGSLSAPASLVAIAAFLAGARVGGRLGARFADRRGLILRGGAAVSLAFVVVGALAAAIGGTHVHGWERYTMIAALAVGMGVQNATARRLAVPDLTTTVLTLTLTGIAADAHLTPGAIGALARRAIAVAAMLTGALVGAVLVIHVDLVVPLVAAAALIAVNALVAQVRSAGAGAAAGWQRGA